MRAERLCSGVIADLGWEWYNDWRGRNVDHTSATRKRKRTARQRTEVGLLGGYLTQLRRVERKLDGLLRGVVQGMSMQELMAAADRQDVLVSSFSRLRLPNVGQYPEEAKDLLLRLDPTTGPLPGFDEAMERLWGLVITPGTLRMLHSALYTVAAQAADTCPELLPTVALAALSLDTRRDKSAAFLEMVVAASAIEWFITSHEQGDGCLSLDVGGWLATEPSDTLRMAVGEGLAYYYAAIPGVFLFLDPVSVLFDVRRLMPYARKVRETRTQGGEWVLCELVDGPYKLRLRSEIERVQDTLRGRYPAKSIADVEMLTHRALQALDDLPPQANPLLQAILVQSWVRYLDEVM